MTERSRLSGRTAWGLQFPLAVAAFLSVAATLAAIGAAVTGEPIGRVLLLLAVSVGLAAAALVMSWLRTHLKRAGRK